MKLTKKQFIAQFPHKTSIRGIEPMHDKRDDFEGVEVWRALNLLLIKIDGEFYCHG